MDIKVSVIIPVYNVEQYLEECLESVIKQTLKEIEVICVDDGSTDHSVQLIKKYCDNYPWIRLITQINQGAGAARNHAMSQAKGQFVCFLDADDYYISEDALEKMYNTAIEEEVYVCAGLLQIEFKGEVEKNPVLRNLLKGRNRTRVLYQDFQFDYQYQCYLFDRKFLNKYKIEFPEYRRFQDPPFFVQALFYAEEFVIVKTEFYFYRRGWQKPQFTDEKTRDLLEGLLFNLNFAKTNGLESLFELTLSRINQDYFDILYLGLEKHIKSIKERFMEMNQTAKEKGLCFEALELHLLKKGEYCTNVLFDKIEKKIEKNTNIVVYGAGDVGKKCVLYLTNSGYANVVMWIDHYKCGIEYFSWRLYDLCDLSSIQYDKVLIAVKSQALSNEIKCQLLSSGILENSIIEWCDNEIGGESL